MKIIGLTGGIGSGKTTVARLFAQRGIPVVDADLIARNVVLPNTPTLDQIILNFGDTVLTKEGQLNRKKMAKIIFDDDEKRQLLESIIHPAIDGEIETQIKQYKKRSVLPFILLDIPLLFETNKQGMCDEVWLVIIDEEKQILRISERDGLSYEAILKRIRAQMPQDQKKALANIYIDNNYLLDDLKHQVDELIKYIKKD